MMHNQRNLVKTTTRRHFLVNTGALCLGSIFSPSLLQAIALRDEALIKSCGPASVYRTRLSVAFVRRQGEYGMWWPGQIYDGESALKKYQQKIKETAGALNMRLDLRELPIYSGEEADGWISRMAIDKPDGILIVLLDRQQHAWPTVEKSLASGIPTVVFSPLGTSFTTNTGIPSRRAGVTICSTDDFNQVSTAIKMIDTGAKVRETKFLVIKGDQRLESEIPYIGTKLQYIPAQDFVLTYKQVRNDSKLDKLVDDLIGNATMLNGPSQKDVTNGIKSYLVAKNLLEREKCDGITMDCLGTLKDSKISLPCIAWSKMNDHGIPAACEADLGACITHAIVQYLFDRPGFQQDPVAETARGCLIGSHCSCPTRLNGFAEAAEAYDIVHHHASRDATARTFWKPGQRVTIADLLLSENKEEMEMIISSGTVIDNKSIPPAGGCVVAPMIRIDNVEDTLDYPGFHQVFFYGDYKKELKAYCQLQRISSRIV